MSNKPVLLIRGTGNERDAAAFAALGIATVSEPFTDISAADPHGAHELLRLLGRPNAWVILTSRNALTFWAQSLAAGELHAAFTAHPTLKFAAVGVGTAELLAQYGVTKVVTPQAPLEANSEGLLSVLSEFPAGLALLPAGNLARQYPPEGLRLAGWQVESRVVYENKPLSVAPKSVSALCAGEFGAVVVRAPSSVQALHHFLTARGFGEASGFPISDVPLICGGAQSAQCARELGFQVAATASDPSPEAIAELTRSTLAHIGGITS